MTRVAAASFDNQIQSTDEYQRIAGLAADSKYVDEIISTLGVIAVEWPLSRSDACSLFVNNQANPQSLPLTLYTARVIDRS